VREYIPPCFPTIIYDLDSIDMLATVFPIRTDTSLRAGIMRKDGRHTGFVKFTAYMLPIIGPTRTARADSFGWLGE